MGKLLARAEMQESYKKMQDILSYMLTLKEYKQQTDCLVDNTDVLETVGSLFS